MPLVNAGRLTQFFKGLAGFRGPYSMNLDQGLVPVADVVRPAAVYDDGTVYFRGRASQGASVGNFSAVILEVVSGRLVVDEVWVEQEPALQTFTFTQTTPLGAGNGVVVVNIGPGKAGINQRIANANVLVATPAAIQGISFLNVQVPAAGPALLVPMGDIVLDASIPAFRALAVWTSAVNLPIAVSFRGRLYSSFPE